jgi:phospholipid/cholesterol/gamma-HCH transport system ATP-binding protein
MDSQQNSRHGVSFHRDPRPVSPSRQPYLKLDHVSISFGSNRVLNDVSFAVMPGETMCILGRSGVGKSVCLRLIMGFLKPDAGRVIAAEKNITDHSEHELVRIHKQVTMVFQSGALFDYLTVWDNVAFPLRARRELSEEQISRMVAAKLKLVGIEEYRDAFASEISTGTKRVVAIARALAANPQAVLYDEPTTMVDPIMARRMADVIERLKQRMNLTSVVVTHDTRLAEKVADRVIFLDAAKVIFNGTLAEMKRSSVPLVREFLNLDSLDFRFLLENIKPQQKVG